MQDNSFEQNEALARNQTRQNNHNANRLFRPST